LRIQSASNKDDPDGMRTKVTESADSPPTADAGARHDVDLVELIFFAYRDFVGEPDRVLARYGFGRAHHRVLHFVLRQPGLSVASLLDLLQITKQSLARVLKDLLEQGHVSQRSGEADRRQRLLFLTPKGAALAEELLAGQTNRVAQALAACGQEHRDAVRAFLLCLIDAEIRQQIAKRLG
jgi:DNA-binding MarR family transcriptional regulator